MGIRSFVKKHDILYKPASFTRKTLRNSLRQTRVLLVAVRRGTLFSGLSSISFSKTWKGQSFLEYSISIPYCSDAKALIEFLLKNKLHFVEGRWTIYFPPQNGLENIFPFMKQYSSSNIGIKLLKAFEGPYTVKYVNETFYVHPSHPFWSGDIPQLMRIANYLYRNAIGSKLHDVISIKSESQTFTAFLIKHIESEKLQEGDFDKFIKKLRDILSKNEIIPSVQSWETHKDYLPPDCNGNLLKNTFDQNLYYVDFQSFMFKNELRYIKNLVRHHKKTLHFGSDEVLLGGRILYQSVPGLDHGRRDTTRRWNIFEELLSQIGETLQDKVVFDVCCNSGMILNHCLVNGAYWGIGWDLPEVAEIARSLQSVFGMTRIDIFGGTITQDTDFLKDVPLHIRNRNDSILFFLAAKKHIGFPPGVGRLLWKTMIYEGHEAEDFEKTRRILGDVPWLQNASIEAMTTNKTELGEIRTIAILTRK